MTPADELLDGLPPRERAVLVELVKLLDARLIGPPHAVNDNASAGALRDRVLCRVVAAREAIAAGDVESAEAAAYSAEVELAAIVEGLEERASGA